MGMEGQTLRDLALPKLRFPALIFANDLGNFESKFLSKGLANGQMLLVG